MAKRLLAFWRFLRKILDSSKFMDHRGAFRSLGTPCNARVLQPKRFYLPKSQFYWQHVWYLSQTWPDKTLAFFARRRRFASEWANLFRKVAFLVATRVGPPPLSKRKTHGELPSEPKLLRNRFDMTRRPKVDRVDELRIRSTAVFRPRCLRLLTS